MLCLVFMSKFTDGVFPFHKNPENVSSVKEVTFLRVKAPRFKAFQTQEVLEGTNFFK